MKQITLLNADQRGVRFYKHLLSHLEYSVAASTEPSDHSLRRSGLIVFDRYRHSPRQYRMVRQLLYSWDLPVVVVGDSAAPVCADTMCRSAGVAGYFTRPLPVQSFVSFLHGQCILPSSRMDGYCSDDQDSQAPSMEQVCERADKYARCTGSIVIYGESGTGKERIARRIHTASRYREGPFVPINCGAIPENLFESDVFGVVNGAYTGARERCGAFRSADGGTLFLDEISEMPLVSQAALLRTIETGLVRSVGSDRYAPVDVRIVAATNRDLWGMVERRGFRGDLFFRLVIFSVCIPPLRFRVFEIPSLVREIIATDCDDEAMEMTPEAIARLQGYHWPGNVRELRNVVQRAAANADSRIIQARDIDFNSFLSFLSR